MKTVLLALLTIVTSLTCAKAGPYFRLEPFREISNGAFFKLGDPQDNVLLGQKTSIITHHAEDGYLVIPNVTWNLLDAGWAVPVNGRLHNAFLELGPSVRLDEPIKAVIRSALSMALGPDLGFLNSVLAPGQTGWALNVGPGLGIQMSDDINKITGRFNLHVGLGARF